MSAPLCTVCLDTGSKSQDIDGFLDCVACDAVANRLEMQNHLAGLSPFMNPEQRAWAAYNFGIRKAAPVVPVAAQPVVPIAWRYEWASFITTDGPQDFRLKFEAEPPPDWAVADGQARNVVALYAAPQPAASVTDVAKDAARYRWLLNSRIVIVRPAKHDPELTVLQFSVSETEQPHSIEPANRINAAIDAAIAAQQGEKNV